MNTLLTCFSFTMQLKINRICPRLNNQFVLTSACETRSSSLMRGFRKRVARRAGPVREWAKIESKTTKSKDFM